MSLKIFCRSWNNWLGLVQHVSSGSRTAVRLAPSHGRCTLTCGSKDGPARGLARARKHGTKSGRPSGRPKIDPATEAAIREDIRKGGKGLHKIAAEHAVGTGTVQRIKAEIAAEA
jgi:hypothetical protein